MMKEEMDFTDAEMLRKLAEDKLQAIKNNKDITLVEPGMQKILHELQVHQIELEMQNDELRQAYEIAETALKKYTILYDLAPLGYFTLNSDGNICELNFTGSDLLGGRRFSLINSNFKLFVSEDSKPVFNKFLSEVYEDNGKKSCRVALGHDPNSFCHVYIEGIVTGDGKECLLSVIDISDFKQ